MFYRVLFPVILSKFPVFSRNITVADFDSSIFELNIAVADFNIAVLRLKYPVDNRNYPYFFARICGLQL